MSSPDIASTAPPRATAVDDQVAEADRSRPRAAVKNRRKLYLDLVVVEASDVKLQVESEQPQSWLGFMGSLVTGKRGAEPDLYCAVRVAHQEYKTSVCEKEPAPIWNETCTFTTDVMSEAQLVLEIDVLDRTDRVFGSDRVVTRVALPLRDIPYDAMQDVWVECFPFVELAAVPPIHPLDHRASSIPSVSEAQRTPQRDQPPAPAAVSTPLLGSAPSQQQQQHLPTPVVSVVVRRTSQLTPIEPGGQARSIAMPACNINYYTLDDRLWFAPPPSSVEQQEAGNDSEAMHEAKLARLCDGIDAKYSRAPCARLHLMYHKSLDPKAGPWSFYGTPQVEVPLRMDAGDIILVNSSYFLTHSIKVTTWSQWDHIAMVTKIRHKRGLYLLEATMEGVATYTLSSALQVYRESSTIGIRRLKMDRNPAMIRALMDYVESVHGKPFTTNLLEFIRAAYGSNQSDDTNSLFCSQLIAKAYKEMGILPQSVLANNFVPSHFALEDLGVGLPPGMISKLVVIPQLPAAPAPVSPKADSALASSCAQEADGSGSNIRHVRIIDSITQLDARENPYTSYVLEVGTDAGTGWVCFKRYSEFAALHNQLKRVYSGLQALPPKTITNRTKLSLKVVRLRQRALEAYLQLLLEDPLTRHCPMLRAFLACPSEQAASMTAAPRQPPQGLVVEELDVEVIVTPGREEISDEAVAELAKHASTKKRHKSSGSKASTRSSSSTSGVSSSDDTSDAPPNGAVQARHKTKISAHAKAKNLLLGRKEHESSSSSSKHAKRAHDEATSTGDQQPQSSYEAEPPAPCGEGVAAVSGSEDKATRTSTATIVDAAVGAGGEGDAAGEQYEQASAHASEPQQQQQV